ncbi:MAG: hypothetical protein IJN68_00590 [Clostridia bacterium]|nr:hypothetical protein [Clostridia bacterium]
MKLAIIGSRSLKITDLNKFIPDNVSEIVSGGAKGIDTCAKEFAISKGLAYTEFLPQYEKYGKAAPIVRNKEIVKYADEVLAFWDGKSKGCKNVIDYCKKENKKITVEIIKKDE